MELLIQLGSYGVTRGLRILLCKMGIITKLSFQSHRKDSDFVYVKGYK